jgi:cytochrome c553
MKANMNAAVAASDFPGLATALDKAATFAPAGYTNWASIAKDGAKAARAQDMTAAKASCRTCHEQYKEKFKKDTAARTKKI